MFEGMPRVRKTYSSRSEGWSVYRHNRSPHYCPLQKQSKVQTPQDQKGWSIRGSRYVNDIEEEGKNEEDDIPLKCKRQGKEEASRSKRPKSSKAEESKKTLSSALSGSPKKKKPTNPPIGH